MGLGRGEAAKMSKGMVNLAGDMASFNNATPEETFEALRAGISGETEPLRRFGVRLSRRASSNRRWRWVSKRAKSRSTITPARSPRKRSSSRTRRTPRAISASTSDSLANQQRILSAQYENVTAAIGQKLLPVIKLLTDNMDIVLVVVGVLTAAVVALGIAMAVAWIAALSPVDSDRRRHRRAHRGTRRALPQVQGRARTSPPCSGRFSSARRCSCSFGISARCGASPSPPLTRSRAPPSPPSSG